MNETDFSHTFYHTRSGNFVRLAGCYSNSKKSIKFFTQVTDNEYIYITVNETGYVPVSNIEEVTDMTSCALSTGFVFLEKMINCGMDMRTLGKLQMFDVHILELTVQSIHAED